MKRPLIDFFTLSIPLIYAFNSEKGDLDDLFNPSQLCDESTGKISRFALKYRESRGIGYNLGYSTLEAFFGGMKNDSVFFLDARGDVFNNSYLASIDTGIVIGNTNLDFQTRTISSNSFLCPAASIAPAAIVFQNFRSTSNTSGNYIIENNLIDNADQAIDASVQSTMNVVLKTQNNTFTNSVGNMLNILVQTEGSSTECLSVTGNNFDGILRLIRSAPSAFNLEPLTDNINLNLSQTGTINNVPAGTCP